VRCCPHSRPPRRRRHRAASPYYSRGREVGPAAAPRAIPATVAHPRRHGRNKMRRLRVRCPYLDCYWCWPTSCGSGIPPPCDDAEAAGAASRAARCRRSTPRYPRPSAAPSSRRYSRVDVVAGERLTFHEYLFMNVCADPMGRSPFMMTPHQICACEWEVGCGRTAGRTLGTCPGWITQEKGKGSVVPRGCRRLTQERRSISVPEAKSQQEILRGSSALDSMTRSAHPI